MSFMNGLETSVNGNPTEVELQQISANGCSLKETHSAHEKEANGFPLIGNGIEKLNHANGSIAKCRIDCHDKESVPFELLCGEYVEQTTFGKETWIILSNFRLFVVQNNLFHNIPARCIEYVEMRDLLGLHVHCKDGKVMRIGFDSQEECSDWWRYITSSEASQSRTEDLFAFTYYKNLMSSNTMNGMKPYKTLDAEGDVPMYVSEIRRMGFDTKEIWRTTEINAKYELCKTYPKFHIVPRCISDDALRRVANFRSLRRFPSVVWRNRSNGAVIVRSSQPEVGWLGWRCDVDESMLPAIGRAAMLDSNNVKVNMAKSVTNVTSSPLPFLVIDARSYAAAVANRAKGGGCECQEYYPNCDIRFMGLPNIHAIRKSFQSVRALCLLGQEQNNWWSALEGTKWLNYLSGLIKSALVVVEAIDMDAQSTLVHCSDGWDRTPQLVSLAQLLLDPYYRTIKGFRVLIEREWLEFGHKFADRCGHSVERDINERSPVFFQWLDVVFQIMNQFPSAFEFNEYFLVKLASHAYSCLFGTFLCNSIRERQQQKIRQNTVSVWDLLLSGRKDFINYLYSKSNKVLYPTYHVRSLQLWETMFLGSSSVQNRFTDITMELTKSLELTDSGNSTLNSDVDSKKKIENGKINSKEYKCKNRKNSKENEITRKHSTGNKPSNILVSAPLRISSSSFAKDNSSPPNSSLYRCSKNKTVDNLENNCRENIVSNNNKIKNRDNITNDQNLNSSNNQDEISLDKLDNVNSSSSQSTLNDEDNTVEFRANEILRKSSETLSVTSLCKSSDTMTDSLRTITGDNEHRKSLDDLCINPNKNSPTPEDLDLSIGDHRGNAMRRAHSSPDSPSLNRLPRTKSVPDVMAASVCVHTDILKKYPSIENNSNTQTKLYSQNFRRFIDIDGLVFIYSFIDQKLIELQNRHAHEMGKLQKKFAYEKQMRIQLQQQQNNISYSPGTYSDDIPDELLSLTESMNGEQSSVSSISNEEGWEQVQFDDVQPTRWLPDHVSPNCSNCGCLFSILIRRHHCRKCGGVFCDSCSNNQIAIPEEQLFNPVRVCTKCYYLHNNVKLG